MGERIEMFIIDNEAGEHLHTCRDSRINLRGVREMPEFKIGDTVVHWIYGADKVVAEEAPVRQTTFKTHRPLKNAI